MRMQTKLYILVGLAALASSMPLPASAQTADAAVKAPAPIGKVETLQGEVNIHHAAGVLVLASAPSGARALSKVGDTVYEGDTVETGANSKVGIAFTDGTAFNLSSSARMTLDKFVYDPNGKDNSTLINLSKGAFTFIAGKVAHTGDMQINTPVATMGIRGTAPHVEIDADGSVKFSTLVEENKNAEASKSGLTAPGQPKIPRGRAQAQPSPAPTGADLAEREYDKRLKICKGC